MRRNQHVVPNGKLWSVKGAGTNRATSTHGTQKKAIEKAREIAQNQRTEVFIHNRQGQFRDRDSYGNDPCPPRDRVH